MFLFTILSNYGIMVSYERRFHFYLLNKTNIMRITVANTSSTLEDILSEGQKTQVRGVRENSHQGDFLYTVEIENKGATELFIDFGADAVVDATNTIAVLGSFAFTVDRLSEVNLISSAENTAVNVIIK